MILTNCGLDKFYYCGKREFCETQICSLFTVLAESTLFWTTDLSRQDSETRRDLPLTSRPTWRRSSAIWKKMTEKTKLPNSSRILTMSWKKWWANSRIFNFTLVRLHTVKRSQIVSKNSIFQGKKFETFQTISASKS